MATGMTISQAAEYIVSHGGADEHSVLAQWFTREQLTTLSLKSHDVKQFVELALDGPVYPLTLLSWEQ